MLLLLFLGYVMSQSCINLGSNSPCGPLFEGAPVALANMDQFLSNIGVFANVSSTVAEINNVGSCSITNDDALKQQYQISFFCAYIIQDALINNGCPAVAPFVPEKALICSDVCNVAVTSVSKSLSSCKAPKNITGGLDYFCSQSSSSNSTCFVGIQSETDFCGFRTLQAAEIGCPTLREDERDAECCKKLIPGVVLLPAQQSGMTMTIGIGVAVGVAAFLILAAMLASCVWCSTSTKKDRSSNGNMLKTNGLRDSLSSQESNSTLTSYGGPGYMDKKPSEFQQKTLAPTQSFEDVEKVSEIRMENPYAASIKIEPRKYLAPPVFNQDNLRDSLLSQASGNYNINRQTIDLDALEISAVPGNSEPANPEQYVSEAPLRYQTNPNLYMSETANYEPSEVSNRDSGFYMRSGAGGQSMYSNLLREQFSEVEQMRENVTENGNPPRNFLSLYSMSTDQFVLDENRDSLQFKFPSPPNNPPAPPRR